MIFKKSQLLKKRGDTKADFLIKFLDDSAWFCMEKLKKHSFETKQPNICQKLFQKIEKYVNKSP